MVHASPYPPPVVPALSLPAFVLEHAGVHRDRPALIDGTTGEVVTYGALAGRVRAVAAALAAAGVGPGDVVGLVGANSPAWVAALYGTLSAGATVVPANPALTAGELAGMFARAGVGLVIADTDAADSDVEARVAPEGPAVLPLQVLAGAPAAPAWSAPAPDPASVAVIAFSSGTTGLPKGVMLTHRNLVANIAQHEHLHPVGPGDVFLGALPFFHSYGMGILLGFGLRHGCTVVTLPRFSPGPYLSALARHRVTWLHVAPPLLLFLTSPAAAGADLSSVRGVSCGAAPLDADLSARAEAVVGTRIRQGWGLTEASPGVSWSPEEREVPRGSVGVLVPGTEARTVDPATGVDAPDGRGELWVRGPQVMAGYLDDPAATGAAVSADGWLRTGDIGTIDGDGVITIVDRLKELIKVKGFQVAPAELEGVLLAHPAVSDAAVVGVPDPVSGEAPRAFVVLRAPVGPDELVRWVAARVAPYKRVREVVEVDGIPRSAAGKVLRRELRDAPNSPARPGG